MMALNPFGAASVINLHGLFIAIPLVLFVLLIARVMAKNKRTRKQKPGQYLLYTAPGCTAAQCRGLLSQQNPDDIFAYTLQGAPSGGWYLHLTLHNATQQPLDTLFLLQFEGDNPALFSLTFVREAFGSKEPVMGEGLLDAFFAAKLGAVRTKREEGNSSPCAPSP